MLAHSGVIPFYLFEYLRSIVAGANTYRRMQAYVRGSGVWRSRLGCIIKDLGYWRCEFRWMHTLQDESNLEIVLKNLKSHELWRMLNSESH
jgi:hypothetical protein